MLVYHLDAKLKSGFDLLRRNFSRSVSACARIVEIKQSIGGRLRNPMIVDRGRHKRGHGLNRPRRALQARLEPIFDGLIAEHHNVVMGQTPARPTTQSPAERANRPALGRVMAFDLFFLRQVGKNRLRVKRHDEHPIRGFYHEDHEGHEGRIIAQRLKERVCPVERTDQCAQRILRNLRVLRAFVVHILYMNHNNY
jgi:hypothetical protein